jgi:hypothetical protein
MVAQPSAKVAVDDLEEALAAFRRASRRRRETERGSPEYVEATREEERRADEVWRLGQGNGSAPR